MLFICAILFYMDTWEFLPKNQTDPQTIAEAIAQAIANHNADPTAHLGPNGSLTAHRQNDIIDHPAGSIVADKLTANQINFDFPIYDYTKFNYTGNVDNFFPGLSFYSDRNRPATVGIFTFFENVVDWDIWSAESQFSFVMRSYDTTTNLYDGIISLGVDNQDTSLYYYSGYGFSIENGNLYAWAKTANAVQKVSLSGVAMSSRNIMRAHFFKDEGVVRYYVNGSQVAEIAVSNFTDPYNYVAIGFRFFYKGGAVSGRYFNIIVSAVSVSLNQP